MSLFFRKNAVGVIYNVNRKILIVQYASTGSWTFIKGGIGENETSSAGLIREINEEVGIIESELVVQFTYLKPYIKEFTPEEVKRKKEHKNELFLGKSEEIFIVAYGGSNELKIDSNELSNYRRVSCNELKDLISRKEILDIIDLCFLDKYLSYTK